MTALDQAMDWLLEADPVAATWLGDHRFDELLPDLSASRTSQLEGDARRLRPPEASDDVDTAIVRARIDALIYERTQLARQCWDPMVWNPGTALHLLVTRGAERERERALQSRLEAIPDHLASARSTLGEMSRIHVETAIEQLTGTAQLIDAGVREVVGESDGLERARASVEDFIQWLRDRIDSAQRSPRLGERQYAAALWYGLDENTSAVHMLDAAEDHLDAVTAQLREAAAEFVGETGRNIVPRAFDEIARRWPVDARTIRPLVTSAMQESLQFIRDRDLVEIPEIDVAVIDMPAIHRGVAVAYCDPPGPLEERSLPTYVAVAPPPETWEPALTASFFREYNGIAVHDLTIHEAYPGHVLQLAHARRVQTRARKFGMSGVFVEGWAVYAEELMVQHGYAPHDANLALRLQQLKFQARMTINAILDVRVHTMDMSEAEALQLMMFRGFQEEGEARGKWRRALLTAGQLPTYFVGYQAIRSMVHDLQTLHPDWSDRRIHDTVLSQGSIAPRHVRALIGF